MELYEEFLNKPLPYWFFAKSKTTAYRKIKKLMREGEIVKLGKNKYAFSNADPFKLCFNTYGGFFSFSTALFLRGFKQEGEKKLYIVVPSYKKKLKFKDLLFYPVKSKFPSPFTSLINDVPVAKLERIIFDCLNIPKYADFYYLLQAIKFQKNNINWNILGDFIIKSNSSTIKRAGFLLDGLAPKSFIEKMLKNRGKSIAYLKISDEITYYKKWNIYASPIIEKWKKN